MINKTRSTNLSVQCRFDSEKYRTPWIVLLAKKSLNTFQAAFGTNYRQSIEIWKNNVFTLNKRNEKSNCFQAIEKTNLNSVTALRFLAKIHFGHFYSPENIYI